MVWRVRRIRQGGILSKVERKVFVCLLVSLFCFVFVLFFFFCFCFMKKIGIVLLSCLGLFLNRCNWQELIWMF